MRERIIQLLRHYNITQTTFAEKIGISKGAVSHVLSQSDKSRKGDFKPETIERIALAFPDLNKNWLVTGEGEMIDSSKSVGPQQPQLDFTGALERRNTSVNNRSVASPVVPSNDIDAMIENDTENNKTEMAPKRSLSNQAKSPDNNEDSSKEILNYLSDSKKKVSRIVIFYSDGSFNQYTPNNDNY